MLITRLHLRNFRVFEEDLEIEVPPGLVGIYGFNGAGKSSLIEAVRFTLYGRTRTSIDEIRTAGVNDDCLTEVDFEHEGHRYQVRRQISGINHTVRASGHADGLQVAEGVRDTARYVHSVLGMDDNAFRASVFAEQKQLAAFSLRAPGERRKLVLSLLGITPVDSARDRARRDARDARGRHDRLRDLLPDLAAIAAELEATRGNAEQAGVRAATAAEEAERLRREDAQARTGLEAIEVRRATHQRLESELRAVAGELAERRSRSQRLEREQAELAQARSRVAELAELAGGRRDAEARLRAVEGVLSARRALESIAVGPEAPLPDEAGLEQAQGSWDRLRKNAAELDGRVRAATDDLARAERASKASAELTGSGACPLCGQDLGDAFEKVQDHRRREAAEAGRRLQALQVELAEARRVESEARTAVSNMAGTLREARRARSEWEVARSRRTEAEAALARATEALEGRAVEDGERARLAEEVERRAAAAEELARLRGRLERSEPLAQELAAETKALADVGARQEQLAKELAEVGFDARAHAAAVDAAGQARRRLEAATEAAVAARTAEASGRVRAEEAERRLADARRQHEALEEVATDARHISRVADLLAEFRNSVIAAVGPRLSAQAADLFAELTDREYDSLEVDPDTYEIKICDQGRTYGMDRFSGSETDLANLALRVAISEHVRFQAGGTVGLLVLDEVFGPLDPDRKARMLLALERLRGRFRQVLVVTHDADIKEQLPNAIEVVKLPGRRATARVMT